MSLAIRKASVADREAVLALLVEAGLPTAGVPSSMVDFVVATDDDKVIGAAGLEVYGTAALLRSVVVSPSARSTGIGRRLVERALVDAAAADIVDVFLLTTSAPDYFPRFGFVPSNREAVPGRMRESAELTGACPSSAAVLRRSRGRAARTFD